MMILFKSLPRWVCLLSSISGFLLISFTGRAQVPAVDSMGANMGRQNWRAAMYWALKAGEALPEDKYWRYLNAAEFASRLQNAALTFEYLSYVVHSNIGTNASYRSDAFAWLHGDARWQSLMAVVSQAQEQERQQRLQASQPFRQLQATRLEASRTALAALDTTATANELYAQLQQLPLPNLPPVKGRYQYAWLQLNDSTTAPYLIQLPPAFDNHQSYPLVVVLHGAVRLNAAFPEVPDSTHTFFGRAFMQKAGAAGMIAVFPYSTKQYNWMMPDAGFSLVPNIIAQVKKMYRVDDARVYVTGHSNGATGAFSYLLKQPSLFAAFAGLNNRPQVRTGGTFLKNARNRSFYNVATDYDYYFPLAGHQTLQAVAEQLNLDWPSQEVTGQRTHGYLISAADSVTDHVYQQLFTYLLAKKRDPFKKHLYWESDDTRHGRCDWLEISALDTLAPPASWHRPVNFAVTGWRNPENPALVMDSTSQAFAFPRRSGAVEAAYHKNKFTLKTSGVKTVTLYLSPAMVNLRRPVQITINGRTVFRRKITMDKPFMLKNFQAQPDRQALWVNFVRVTVPD